MAASCINTHAYHMHDRVRSLLGAGKRTLYHEAARCANEECSPGRRTLYHEAARCAKGVCSPSIHPIRRDFLGCYSRSAISKFRLLRLLLPRDAPLSSRYFLLLTCSTVLLFSGRRGGCTSSTRALSWKCDGQARQAPWLPQASSLSLYPHATKLLAVEGIACGPA